MRWRPEDFRLPYGPGHQAPPVSVLSHPYQLTRPRGDPSSAQASRADTVLVRSGTRVAGRSAAATQVR